MRVIRQSSEVCAKICVVHEMEKWRSGNSVEPACLKDSTSSMEKKRREDLMCVNAICGEDVSD